MIELIDVSKTFTLDNKEVHAVKDVSVTIEEGKSSGLLVIVGQEKVR